MSILHGPNIVTDSLVFYHDMNNTSKSYAGPTTTNLASNPNDFTQATWTASAVTVFEPGAEIAPITLSSGFDTRAYKVKENTTSNTQHMIYNTDWASTTLNIGDVYSISVYAKPITRDRLFLTMYGEGYSVFDISQGTIIAKGGNECNIEYAGNGFYRCSATITKTNTSKGFFIGSWQGGSPGSGGTPSYSGNLSELFHISKFQWESGSTTPFVNGTRLNNQHIYDMVTGTSGVSNTLIYNSDNTYVFDQTTSLIDFGNHANFSQSSEITMSAWINPEDISVTANTAAGNIMSKNSNLGYRFRYNASKRIQSLIDGASNILVTPANTCIPETWSNVTVTGSSSGTKIYINGELQANNTIAFAPSDPNGGSLIIGAYDSFHAETFKGKIAITQMYSRELGANEIKQNFDALKGRFGL